MGVPVYVQERKNMGVKEFMKRMEVSNQRFVTQIQKEISGSSS